MSINKVIILPDSEEIGRRLDIIETPINNYLAEKLYPSIAAEGGRELYPSGIVIMLMLKIHDIIPPNYPDNAPGIMYSLIPKFIDALIDDKAVVGEAKNIYEQYMKNV